MAPALVHEDVGMVVALIRDIFKEDVEELIVDDNEDYTHLIEYSKVFAPELEKRIRLYSGDLFVYTPKPSSVEFCRFTGQLIRDHFEPDDPELAQQHMPVEQYVDILQSLKPTFIHHDESKKYVARLLEDLGFDAGKTYFDVPRLRSSTSDGYLTTGIAYAWHPHRDTWYSAPSTQINVWLPVFDVRADNTVAFHPAHFAKNVENDSERYNYYEWNQKYRAAAASQISKDARPLPRPLETIETDSEIRIVCPVGGVILFSGAHLHSSVPNSSGRTRFSIDFRVVNVDDIQSGQGAPMQDVQCTGSNIRDFISAADMSKVPESVVRLFDDGTEDRGVLEYEAPRSDSG